MKYRLAAFDFDGTLADSGAWFLSIFNELADQFGFQRIEHQNHELLRNSSAADILKLLKVPKWKLPQIMIQVRKSSARDWKNIKLFPGTEKMLSALRNAGLQVVIVSSNSEQTIRNVLGPETADGIRLYACGASLFGKAAKLRSVLRKTRITPSESIYIGDEIRDAVAAREVGVAFGAVSWGYTTPDALDRESPTLRFITVPEIVEKLSRSR